MSMLTKLYLSREFLLVARGHFRVVYENQPSPVPLPTSYRYRILVALRRIFSKLRAITCHEAAC